MRPAEVPPRMVQEREWERVRAKNTKTVGGVVELEAEVWHRECFSSSMLVIAEDVCGVLLDIV